MKRTTVALAVLATLGVSTGNAQAAETPLYGGTGWKAMTDRSIYSISPDPYEIVFAGDRARTTLTPYLKNSVAQLTAETTIDVTITNVIDTTSIDVCPSRHRIVFRMMYRPLGKEGYSQARPCHDSEGAAWGGHVIMDTEYWTVDDWFSSDPVKNEYYRKNGVTHEFGHILGLDHPNFDKDGDGLVEPYECVTTQYNRRPVACSPNGGYMHDEKSGLFTYEFDVPGLKQLEKNWYLRKEG